MVSNFKVISFALIFFFLSCKDQNKPNNHTNSIIEKEIHNRLAILNRLSKYDDSLTFKANKLHRKVSDLLLLSKDVENISANLKNSNIYFNSLSNEFPAQLGLIKLYPGMETDAIETVLLQNELAILNNMIFQNGVSDLQLFSASEDLE